MFHKPNVPALYARIAQSEVEHIQRFQEQARDHHSRELKDLPIKWGDLDPEDASDLAEGDRYFLDEMLKLASQLAIIALYRIVELNSKSIVKSALPNVDPKKFSRIDELSKLLAKELGVDLKQVPYFGSIDELRLVNNAIKHEGKVDEDLAKYPGWTKGDELVNIDAAFERLVKDVPKYIEALAAKVA